MTLAEVTVGTVIATTSGTTIVTARWETSVAGKPRVSIALSNGLVYANLRPTDTVVPA